MVYFTLSSPPPPMTIQMIFFPKRMWEILSWGNCTTVMFLILTPSETSEICETRRTRTEAQDGFCSNHFLIAYFCPLPDIVGLKDFVPFGTQEQKLERSTTSLPTEHMGLWDSVILELRNKSWKVGQQPHHHSKFWYGFAIYSSTQVYHRMVPLSDKSISGDHRGQSYSDEKFWRRITTILFY